MNAIAVFSEKSVVKILASAIRFANFGIIKEDWGEVYGLLQGKIENNEVIITDAIPFTHTEKDESQLFLKVGFGPEDYVAAAELSEKIAPEFFVGWYHSHPGIDLFLSDFDNETQLGYQNQNPDAIALVVDPFIVIRNPLSGNQMNIERLDEKIFGFKIFRLENLDLGTESGFYEVEWRFNGDIIKTRKIIDSLVEDIPKFLPHRDIETRLEKFIEKGKKKIMTQFYSLYDYLDTLKKKDKKRRREYFAQHYPEIEKLIEDMIKIIEKRKRMLDFLEYRELYIKERFSREFDEFLKFIHDINDKLEKLKKELL
ncbi:MAG: hypothetical protein ACTSPQ_01385 [Candidatus Helarchaeota archaeon]